MEGEFDVRYDKLILAPGSKTNTFRTPGVLEHCYTMKSVRGTTLLRERILDCFELVSLPTFTPQQKSYILHFIIIGGGPSGVEFAAEIDELIFDYLLHIYPNTAAYVRVSVCDVQDKILRIFGEELAEYAIEKFRRRDVNVCMERHIEGFERGLMHVKEVVEVKFGFSIW